MENSPDLINFGNSPSNEDGESALSWKEKYELSERQLNQVRKQAAKIREVISIKIQDYEERVLSAEKKRDETLEMIEKLEMACQDKDEAISALREKINRLREERNELIALDEEKMTKIKEWVKSKMTEVLKDLEKVKRERDELRIECDRARRDSMTSEASSVSPLYEEIFGDLFNNLRSNGLHKPLTPSSSSKSNAPPVVPPRRQSMRQAVKPKIKPKIPLKPKTSNPYSLARPMPKDFGSLQSLNEEIDSLAKDEVESFQRAPNEGEPPSPVYFMLQSGSGMEFEEESHAPVYATLGGNGIGNSQKLRVASIIRHRPFTGDTSDSEGPDSDTEPKTANNLPIKTKPIVAKVSPLANDVLKSSPPSESKMSDSPDGKAGGGQLKTCAQYTSQNMREETLEKAGWLMKMGGRVKNWKRRWFTLSEGKLNYFKSRSDMYRKPIGFIQLKEVLQLSKSERPLTFEVVTPTRTYFLTADNADEVNDWLRVLRNSMKRFSGAQLLSKTSEKTVFSGWLTKAKYGSSKHCWAVLKEKSLSFYKTDLEQTPIKTITLREIINVSPVKENPDDDDQRIVSKFMIQCLKDTHPTYFLVSSRSEMELWLHHLQNMCSNGSKNETDFEQIVKKLMNIDGDAASRYWRSKIMVHSKNLIRESLSSLPTAELETESIFLFKSIDLFSTTAINETAVDYHVTLAQEIIQTCINRPELQTEIYCQLIKQTSKYRSLPLAEGASFFSANDWLTHQEGKNRQGTIDMQPVSSFVYMQCWQLLALCTSIFLPKLHILWLLKAHLHRNANESSDIGRYALYCQRSLERTLQNGERETRPSRLETISLISRNPYYRIYPMSVPVYFINSSYQLFSFDGSTTVAEFCAKINQEIGVRKNTESGYALFTDNPVANVEHCLQGDLKVCDVISKWEQAAQSLKAGRFERSKSIKFTYKCRLFFKSLADKQTEKENFFHVYALNESLRKGHIIPKPSTVAKLTALHAQLEFGDYVDHFKLLEDVMQKIYPNYNMIDDPSLKRKIFKTVADMWSSLKGRTIKECVSSYISILSPLPMYGCRLFKAQEKFQVGDKDNHQNVWIAVEEDKMSILSRDMEVLREHNWKQLSTFGGYQEDFMIVVENDKEDEEKTIRYLFAMPQGRVLEVTFLIASYINAVVARYGLNIEPNKEYPLVHDDSLEKKDDELLQLWDMETE